MSKTTSNNVRPLRRPADPSSGAGRRLRANWSAVLRSDRSHVPCTVLDISSTGASLRITATFGVAAQAWLVIGGRGPIAATVVWRRSDKVGLRFLEVQHWIVELRAKRFDPAAWLNDR